MLKGKRLLVTGASGLIGSALCRKLLDEGAMVVGLVRNQEKARQVLSDCLARGLDLQVADILQPLDFNVAVDAVIHTACPTASRYFVDHPQDTYRTIVDGTRNVLTWASIHKARFVYVSSMEVYGQCAHEVVTEDDLGYLDPQLPRNSYPLGKREAESLCLQAAACGNEVVVVRPVQTFGPGVSPTDSRVFMQFIRAKMSGQNIVLKTDGQKAHCYCDIDDCIRGILLVLDKGVSGQIYNISNEKTFCTIREMAEMLVGPEHVKIELDPGIYPPNTRLCIKSDKLRALGWQPRYSLGEMYARLEAYLNQQEVR